MIPVFTLKLNHKILPRLVTVGKYDGKHPCLTAATNGNKVFIHSPHGTSSSSLGGVSSRISSVDSDISLLSFGQHITSLSSGSLNDDGRDVLLIGSQTHVLAYDVEKNSDLFYKEINDGATSIIVGSHVHHRGNGDYQPLAYIGGSCSVTGYDKIGEEKFWTVTGDNVHSMAICDYNCDGQLNLLVGSEDYDIRIFEGDEMTSELSEDDAITSLCSLGRGRYGYALLNGIVGVYSGETRLWRSKSKHTPMCIAGFDYTGNGVLEMVIGWSNGKMDIRNQETGEVLCKTMFGSHIAGIVTADYRLDGKEELICCSVDGEVRGFLPLDPSTSKSSDELTVDMLEDLTKKKMNLLLELKNFEVSQTVRKSRNPQLEISRLGDNVGALPLDTRLSTSLKAISSNDDSMSHVSLTVKTTNKLPIKTVAVFSDGLFDGDSHVVHPPSDSSTHVSEVPLFPAKDIPYDISINVFVGNPGSIQFHVLETATTIPRFALYVPCPVDTDPRPEGSVVFTVNERLDRIKSWINSNFLYPIDDKLVKANQSTYFEVSYMSLRTGSPFSIKIAAEKGYKVTIATDDLDLAGDLVQAMADEFEIEDLSSVAEFPKHMEDLKNIMLKVQEFHAVRETLSADLADHAGMIRNLIVRAEDARIMEEMKSMRMAYNQLYELNKEIMRGYEIRRSNHVELLECLKIVNQAIQKSARLRVGKPKTICTNSCRQAIKDMDPIQLIKAVTEGQ